MISDFNPYTSLDNQQKWKLLQYEIRGFTVSYCKQRTKKDEAERKYQNELLYFYETLFRNTSVNTFEDCERFLNNERFCSQIKL